MFWGHLFNILNTIQKIIWVAKLTFKEETFDIVRHYHSLQIIKILQLAK